MDIKMGDKIKIIFMQGEPDYTYKEGVVTHIDDAGQVWLDSCGCALIPNVDVFEVIERTANE